MGSKTPERSAQKSLRPVGKPETVDNNTLNFAEDYPLDMNQNLREWGRNERPRRLSISDSRSFETADLLEFSEEIVRQRYGNSAQKFGVNRPLTQDLVDIGTVAAYFLS